MQFYRDHFGKKLKEAIKAASTSQSKLADELEIEPATVSRWVNGVDFPNDRHLPNICKFLRVDLGYFGYEESTLSSEKLVDFLFANKEILHGLTKIPKDVLKMLGNQDQIYFESLKRTLEGLEAKKNAPKKMHAKA